MGNPLAFKLIRTIDEFHSLSDEWNSLLAVSASHVPFLRHEYQTSWWRTLGGGEWSEGELYVVTARGMDGALAGIAPLFYTRNLEGERAMMLIGSIEISDYLDVVARYEDLPVFLEGLLDYLSGPQFPSWAVLDWYNLLENSPTIPPLADVARRCGWSYTQGSLQHCPSIPLPGDWEAYLAGIDKKQRHEVRRKLRRAESSDVPVRWYIVQDEASLDAEVEAFFHLMAQDEAKQAFLTENMRTQMRASAKAAFQAGWLQLAFLEVGGEKAAGYLNFDYDNRIWVYNSGIDARFSTISPGWVLLGRLLEWANDHQRSFFDFLRGSEDYKYRFGGIDRYVVRAKIRR
jgi:CelD/BcsL family acetyltransferase involved in cellulose biosynthesis